MVINMEYETFYDTIKELETSENNFTYRLTIPIKIVKFTGFKKGDLVKVMIKKIAEETPTTNK